MPSPQPLHGFLHTMGALSEEPMCHAITQERLNTGSSDTSALLLEGILTQTMAGDVRARRAALGYVGWLIQANSARRNALLHSAQNLDLPLAEATLTPCKPFRALANRGRLPEVGIVEDIALTHLFKIQGLDLTKLTPNECRRIMAMRHARERLRNHPSPRFIRRLIQQRWLRLKDILFIATRQPTVPALATAIAAEHTWLRRHDVRQALATNPYTPTTLTLGLLATLQRPILRGIANGHEPAHPHVRKSAALMLNAS